MSSSTLPPLTQKILKKLQEEDLTIPDSALNALNALVNATMEEMRITKLSPAQYKKLTNVSPKQLFENKRSMIAKEAAAGDAKKRARTRFREAMKSADAEYAGTAETFVHTMCLEERIQEIDGPLRTLVKNIRNIRPKQKSLPEIARDLHLDIITERCDDNNRYTEIEEYVSGLVPEQRFQVHVIIAEKSDEYYQALVRHSRTTMPTRHPEVQAKRKDFIDHLVEMEVTDRDTADAYMDEIEKLAEEKLASSKQQGKPGGFEIS